MKAPALSPPSPALRLPFRPSWSVWRATGFWWPSVTFVSAGKIRKALFSQHVMSECFFIKNAFNFISEQCGLMTSLAAHLRMRSRSYSTSTSDIKLWDRQELLLWWAQNRTWQKYLSNWWNLMERYETWSGEPKATEPSQLSSRTPGSQAQLFDGSVAELSGLILNTRPFPCLASGPLSACCYHLSCQQALCSLLGTTKPNVNDSDLQMCSNIDVFRKIRNCVVAKKLGLLLH